MCMVLSLATNSSENSGNLDVSRGNDVSITAASNHGNSGDETRDCEANNWYFQQDISTLDQAFNFEEIKYARR